jgi:hypothetical protein
LAVDESRNAPAGNVDILHLQGGVQNLKKWFLGGKKLILKGISHENKYPPSPKLYLGLHWFHLLTSFSVESWRILKPLFFIETEFS